MKEDIKVRQLTVDQLRALVDIVDAVRELMPVERRVIYKAAEEYHGCNIQIKEIDIDEDKKEI